MRVGASTRSNELLGMTPVVNPCEARIEGRWANVMVMPD